MMLFEKGFKIIKIFPINLIGEDLFLKNLINIFSIYEIYFILSGGITLDNMSLYNNEKIIGFSTSSIIDRSYFNQTDKVKETLLKIRGF